MNLDILQVLVTRIMRCEVLLVNSEGFSPSMNWEVLNFTNIKPNGLGVCNELRCCKLSVSYFATENFTLEFLISKKECGAVFHEVFLNPKFPRQSL